MIVILIMDLLQDRAWLSGPLLGSIRFLSRTPQGGQCPILEVESEAQRVFVTCPRQRPDLKPGLFVRLKFRVDEIS